MSTHPTGSRGNSPPSSQAATSVLFVDVKLLLERRGYRCTTAANSAEARQRLSEQAFELAVVDIQMPGESGLDLAKSIRADYPNTAVLMATGIDDLRVADAALKAGAYGYLVKPFEENQLLINVAAVLDRRKLELENQQQQVELERLIKARAVEVQLAAERLSQNGENLQAT
jgi:putative two-component system response regulator